MAALYTTSLTQYNRRKTIEVKIGGVPVGGDNPIRIQSMTTVDTMDTEGSIEQSIRMVEAGCEYVRMTAPSIKEAKNLKLIKDGLLARGVDVPLIADIHFTPNAAEYAAQVIEKVRINPGNYVDKKKFDFIEYTDESYQEELDKIEEKFIPLINLCKAHHTAIRIGTNHGSLSDRITSRYGDTPHGMVESALEFLRICEKENFTDVVISMKSSNPLVMVQAYRMLVQKLQEEDLKAYPLHLGVTEAGEGEDGRIKSALGIGTLLEDGLGDTIRVSLTEEPEFEAPVAKALVDRYNDRENHSPIKPIIGSELPYSPYSYKRRFSNTVRDIGTGQVPVVISDLSTQTTLDESVIAAVGHYYIPATDKWVRTDFGADYLYLGKLKRPKNLPGAIQLIQDFENWDSTDSNSFPLFSKLQINDLPCDKLSFISVSDKEVDTDLLTVLKDNSNVCLILSTENQHALSALRRVFVLLEEKGISVPVIVEGDYSDDEETVQLFAATDLGGLFLDGFGDGIFLKDSSNCSSKERLKSFNSTAFGVLQASRTRISKTEYISCPSCGRTLFDLQETTAMIRERTSHLKGLKIGIMGCIVNGPGEMADADYGYVGVGVDKISLYRGQEVVKKGVSSEDALNELIDLIKTDGKWLDQTAS